jgi:hypothetical protein
VFKKKLIQNSSFFIFLRLTFTQHFTKFVNFL